MARFSKIGGVVAAGALLASSAVANAQMMVPATQVNSLFRFVDVQVSVFLPMISISCFSNQAGCVLPLDADDVAPVLGPDGGAATAAGVGAGVATGAAAGGAGAAAAAGGTGFFGSLLVPALAVGAGGTVAVAASGGETSSRGT